MSNQPTIDFSKFIKIEDCSWCGKSGGEHPECKAIKERLEKTKS